LSKTHVNVIEIHILILSLSFLEILFKASEKSERQKLLC